MTRYQFVDDSGETRLSGTLDPEPGGTFNGGTIEDPLIISDTGVDPGFNQPDIALKVVPQAGSNDTAVFYGPPSAPAAEMAPVVLIDGYGFVSSAGGYITTTGDTQGLKIDGSDATASNLLLCFGGSFAVRLQVTRDAVFMPTLPTDDPLVIGQLWNDGGVVTVSAGPP